MKVLALNPVTGDLQFDTIFKNSSEGVAQCVYTRLKLFLGEWWLNTQDGTDWYGSVIGYNTPYDLTIKNRILGTPGVVEIVDYSSVVDKNRNLSVTSTILTNFSVTPVEIFIKIPSPV